jgi:hypothetical protein
MAQGSAGDQSTLRNSATGGAVSILTEAAGDGDDRAIEAVTDLARHFTDTGRIRILPIIGRGVASNVRDLLYQRGIDFAVLGSDTFAYLDTIGQIREARSKVRYVTHLYDRRLLLFTRSQIADVRGLAGKRVATIGSGSSGHAMATTLLGLLGLPVRLEAVNASVLRDPQMLQGFDAILALDHDVGRSLPLVALEKFVLRPIPSSSVTEKVYHRALVVGGEIPGFTTAAPVETIAASVLLISFDWNPNHARFAEIQRFTGSLFSALPELRQRPDVSIWRYSNAMARPNGGWTRYSLAQPERVLTVEQRASLSNADVLPRISIPAAALPPAVVPAPPPTPVPALAAAAQDAVAQEAVAQEAVKASPLPVASAALKPPAPKVEIEAPRVLEAPRPLNVFRVRAEVSARAPLTDPRSPVGGLVLDLLRQSIAAGENEGRRTVVDVIWPDPLQPDRQTALDDRETDIFLPWEKPECDRPNELSRNSAVLCDVAVLSDPVLQVLVGIFEPVDRPFRIDATAGARSRIVCLPPDRDVADLNVEGRQWLSQKRVTVVRRATLMECLGAVQAGDADAFVANDLEGRHLLGQLGLTPLFRMAEPPLATRGIHVAVGSARPNANELVKRINDGLAKLKQSDAYSALISRHLVSVWSDQMAKLR